MLEFELIVVFILMSTDDEHDGCCCWRVKWTIPVEIADWDAKWTHLDR